MARRKITLAFIKNQTNRKASFKKRRKGLIKKVEEISTLCDVEACAVILNPYDEKIEIWPSPEGALAVLKRYGAAVSGIHHRPPKEMDQESFILHRVKKNREKLDRLLMENKRNDLSWFMYRCMAGTNSLHNLDERERAEMCRLINQRIRDVDSKIENLMKEGVWWCGCGGSTSSSGSASSGGSASSASCCRRRGEHGELHADSDRARVQWASLDIDALPYPHLFTGTGSGAHR
ncbi:mads-box transcription factor pheres 2 [Phtheirospermum japonicum]|uniref:Mads-box transcription factor pheres 2 n=1 Tax=Phtheirospermum japonicum TaxID=374723 RepID=A0A830DPU1_9LAMI|nr:mads-box transcription factor pheres 2 [Phtheirospermum japonicum]